MLSENKGSVMSGNPLGMSPWRILLPHLNWLRNWTTWQEFLFSFSG